MRWIVPLALTLSCTPSDDPPQQPGAKATPEPMSRPTCLERFEVEFDRSVLAEQRRRGGGQRWDDFPTRYRAAYLDPDTQRPVDTVESFEVGDTPYLWFSADLSEAVVNAAVLGDLKVVDVTSLSAGDRVQVGTMTELGLAMIERRAFVRFLMRADVLRTYMHLGSSVCIESERDDATGYVAKVSGEHTGFTNEKNVDTFAFEVEVDPSGAIWARGSRRG